MNGAIMALPRDGPKDNLGRPVHYDRAYYIGEQDIYLPADEQGRPQGAINIADSMIRRLPAMKGLIPQYVVFNGRVGALTGDQALTAKVGEKVLFIHSQANRDSRPRLIGGHGDLVWSGGSFSAPPLTNQEAWGSVLDLDVA
jgi:nitrite reductase (NO-forming)